MKSQLEGGSRSFPAPSRSVTSGPLVPTKRACVNWLPGQSAAPSSECRSTLIARMAASHPTRGRSEPPSCRRRLPSRGTAQSRRPAHPRAHWILPGTSARSRYPTHGPSAESVHEPAPNRRGGGSAADQLVAGINARTVVGASPAAYHSRRRTGPSSAQLVATLLGSGNSAKGCRKRRATG